MPCCVCACVCSFPSRCRFRSFWRITSWSLATPPWPNICSIPSRSIMMPRAEVRGKKYTRTHTRYRTKHARTRARAHLRKYLLYPLEIYNDDASRGEGQKYKSTHTRYRIKHLPDYAPFIFPQHWVRCVCNFFTMKSKRRWIWRLISWCLRSARPSTRTLSSKQLGIWGNVCVWVCVSVPVCACLYTIAFVYSCFYGHLRTLCSKQLGVCECARVRVFACVCMSMYKCVYSYFYGCVAQLVQNQRRHLCAHMRTRAGCVCLWTFVCVCVCLCVFFNEIFLPAVCCWTSRTKHTCYACARFLMYL